MAMNDVVRVSAPNTTKAEQERRRKIEDKERERSRPRLERANPNAVSVEGARSQLRALREDESSPEQVALRGYAQAIRDGKVVEGGLGAAATIAPMVAGMFAGRIKATNGGVLKNDARLYHGGLPLNGKIRTNPGSKVPVSETGVVGFRASKDYYDAYRNVRGGLMYDVVIPKGTRVASISEGSLDTLTADQASILASKGFPVAVGIDNTGKTTVAVLDADALAKYMSVRKDDLYRASLMNSIARDTRGEYVASHGTTAKNALAMLSGDGIRNLSSAIVPAGELSRAGNGFGINARSGTGVRFFLKNDAVVPSVDKRQVVYKGDAFTLTESQLKRKVQALRKQNPGMSEESAVESVLKSTHEDVVRNYNREDRANAEELARSIFSKDNPTEEEIAEYLGKNAEYGDILINGDSIPQHFLDTGAHNLVRDMQQHAENTTVGTGGYAEGKMYRIAPASEVFGGAIVENKGGAESTALRKALDKAGVPHSVYNDDVSELAEQVRIAPRLDVRQDSKGGEAGPSKRESTAPTDEQLQEAAAFLRLVVEKGFAKTDDEIEKCERLARAIEAAVGAKPVEPKEEPLAQAPLESGAETQADLFGGQTLDEEERAAQEFVAANGGGTTGGGTEVAAAGGQEPAQPAQPQETLAPGLTRSGARDNVLEYNGRRITSREFDRIQSEFAKAGQQPGITEAPQGNTPSTQPTGIGGRRLTAGEAEWQARRAKSTAAWTKRTGGGIDEEKTPNDESFGAAAPRPGNLRQNTQVDSGRRDALGRPLDRWGRVIA